jgi:PAS domain S-box-containing protein
MTTSSRPLSPGATAESRSGGLPSPAAGSRSGGLPSPAADRRTAYRRLVLAAARGEPLDAVARIALLAACTTCGAPAAQLSLVDEPDIIPPLLHVAVVVGADDRPDLAAALAEPGPPPLAPTVLATGRARWSGAGDGGPFRLAVPVSHGDVVAVMEIVADAAFDVDAGVLDALAELCEVLGAVVIRERAAATDALRPGAADEVTSPAERAMLERLELDRQRLRAAEAIGAFGVWQLVPGQPFSWSEQQCRIHGVPIDFIPTFEDNLALIHPDDLHVVDAYMAQMRADRVAPPLRYRIRRPDGETRWIESHVEVLEGDRVIGVTRDITEQRLREQRDRLLSKIARTMIEGVSLVRADGTILYVNRQYAAMFGYEPEEMEGERVWDHIVPEQRVAPGTIATPRAENLHGEIRHIRRDGTEFTTEANVTAMPIDDGQPGELAWLAVERDITDEKAQSEALRDSEQRLRIIQQHAPIGLALVDLDGRFVQTNPALCAITGRSPHELSKLRLADITHPADLRLSELGIAGVLDGARSTFSTEQRYRRADGATVWVALTVAVARDDEGVPRHLIAQVMDIGARKQAEEIRSRHALELERSNDELRRATDEAKRANQAKNEFLSRMSHELRTPLNAVLGFAQLLGMEELTPTQLDMVDQVLRGGRHLLILIDEVLDIARMENGTMTVVVEAVDVGSAIDHARSLLEPLVRERQVRMRTRLGDDIPLVGADRRRVAQILLNLLSNAVKYNVIGGSVTVSAEVTPYRLMLSVTDTGPGIAPEVLPRLFEPFDRLGAEHTEIEGTGIGLTVSRALAEQMGGRLTVSSTLGEGSTFTLELPRLTYAPRAHTAPTP